MADALTFYRNEDMDLTLTGLKVSKTGAALDAATVTYALKDPSGTTVAGGTGTYDYTAASSGDYTATVDAAVTALMVLPKYYQHVTIVSGGYNGFRKIPVFTEDRGPN